MPRTPPLTPPAPGGAGGGSVSPVSRLRLRLHPHLDLPRQYSEALVRALGHAGVRFLRFCFVDASNQLRCKAVPLSRLGRSTEGRARSGGGRIRREEEGGSQEDEEEGDAEEEEGGGRPCLHLARVAFASVVAAGLPSYGDSCVPGSGLDASGTLFLCPDLSTLQILPYDPGTAVVFGALVDAAAASNSAASSSPSPGPTHLLPPSDLCTRSLLRAVLERAATPEGGAFCLNVGFEIEFGLFDSQRLEPVDRSNFASSTTLDRQQDFVSELVEQLSRQEIELELVHAESAPGQLEVVLPYCRGRYPSDAVRGVDRVYLAAETIRAVARRRGLRAVFLPKMLAGAAGNGLHLHLSAEDRGVAGEKRRRVQESFAEGVLRHLPALAAFTLPTANSYRRVGPGCWTGSAVGWALDDKEVPIRAVPPPPPPYSPSKARRAREEEEERAFDHFEYKICDATANLYLALSAIAVAGMDGVRSGAELRPPLSPQAAASSDEPGGSTSPPPPPLPLPRSVDEALDRLEADEHLRDNLPPALLRAYVAVRRAEARRSVESGATLERELEEAWERA